MSYNFTRALELLRVGSGLGDATFREGQEEAIRHVVEGRGRLLVVQRTGWGKSFVYFIATKLLREQGTWIPSLRHPQLVPDFAQRLAFELGLPFRAAIVKTQTRPEQKTMANSTQQARNVDGSLGLTNQALLAGSVLLVDDMVDSGWTLTVASWLLRAHGRFDVAQGQFTVYAQLGVKARRITGYVKPMFSGLEVYNYQKDKNTGVLHQARELVIGGASHRFKNSSTQQVATEVNLTGKLTSPGVSTWQAFVQVLHNAFIEAILPRFYRSVRSSALRWCRLTL